MKTILAIELYTTQQPRGILLAVEGIHSQWPRETTLAVEVYTLHNQEAVWVHTSTDKAVSIGC
jgi:hypothetical protein